MKFVKWTILAAVLVALVAPAALAGGSVMDISDTSWVGTGTLVMKVSGEGKETDQYSCQLDFEGDGEFSFTCEQVGRESRAEEAGNPDTWSQKGKRIRIYFNDMEAVERDLRWVFEDVFGAGHVTEVKAARVKTSAKLKTKKQQMAWKWKERGKVVDENGKTHKVSLKLKIRDLVLVTK